MLAENMKESYENVNGYQISETKNNFLNMLNKKIDSL